MAELTPRFVLSETRKRRKKGEKSVSEARKLLKDAGKEYLSCSGNVIPEKKQPPAETRCKCRYGCKNLTPNQKLQLFEEFYRMGDNEEQSTFLMGLIHITQVKRRRHGSYDNPAESKRQCTVFYTVPDGQGNVINVCKTTFGDIFAVSKKKISGIIGKKKEGHTVFKETRGNKKKNRKFTEDDKQDVIRHVNTFPRLESHYGRARSQKEYLSPDLNIHRLHRAFKKLNHESGVTYKYYSSIFKKCFPRVKFGHKRTDTCGTCDLLTAKITTDPYNRASLKNKLEFHQRKAERATKQMSFEAKKSQMPRSNTCSTAMDLQQILLTPTLTHGAMYYSRQLSNFNLGVHIENTGDAYMILWNESIAGRGGNEIASCILKMLNNSIINKENLIMWSDNYCGQNKNKMMVFLWAYLTYKKKFKTIEHKFLVSGHSYLSCDRDFALIEKRKRVTNCMVPADIKDMVENTRHKQPFRVIEMTVDDFFNFKIASDAFISTSTLQITKISCIKFDSEQPFIVFFKESHSTMESWKRVNILKKGKSLDGINEYILPKLNCPSKITEEKKKDLLNMIPSKEEHKNYYKSILK